MARKRSTTIGLAILFVAIVATAYFLVLKPTVFTKSPLPIPLVSVAGNWAGYVVTGNALNANASVQGVSGSWVVPSVKSSVGITYSSVWVGIGGQYDSTLIQVGTEQDSLNGSENYYAWYEMLPSTEVTLSSIKVSPGDSVEASVNLVNANSNVWSISIQDVTSNGRFQEDFTYSSPKLSAEWIVERPEINNALTQLANFGSVTFIKCTADVSGKTGAITQFTHDDIFMTPQIINNRSVQLVNVSGLSNQGTKFTVNYISL